MTSRNKASLSALAFAGFFVLQYLAVSNTSVGVYDYIGSTLPYGVMNSYLPLPRGVTLAVYPVFRAIRSPLALLVAWAGATAPGHWSRHLFSLLAPFGNASGEAVKNNHIIFAVINTVFWLVPVGLCIAFLRRPRGSRMLGAAGVTR